MRVRCSPLLAIAMVGLLASGCGSSHHAALTGTRTGTGTVSLVAQPVGSLALKQKFSSNSRPVRALLSKFLASKGYPSNVTHVDQTMRGFNVGVGGGGCYALTVNYRTFKWTARPDKHC